MIRLTYTKKDDYLECRVEDNGVGFENTQHHVTEPFETIENKVRTILNPESKDTGEIINLDEYKKKSWKPKIV